MSSKLRLIAAHAFVFVALSVAIVAEAENVTVIILGTVTSVDEDLASRFSAGDSLVGIYSFDDTTPSQYGSPTYGNYLHAINAVNLAFDGYSAVGVFPVQNKNNVGIENDAAVGDRFRDMYSIATVVDGDDIGIWDEQYFDMSFSILGYSPPTVLTSIALTQHTPPPDPFVTRRFQLTFYKYLTSSRNVSGIVTAHYAVHSHAEGDVDNDGDVDISDLLRSEQVLTEQ